jgi:hypothetical protein
MKTNMKKIKKKTIELILVSTSHGLPNAFRAENKFLKLMWLFLFLICISTGCYTVFSSINDYLQYEVVNKIEINFEMPARFPTITIINLRNPNKYVKLNEILLWCVFNNQPCNESDFTIQQDSLGFVSYTFKSRNSFFTGYFNGLHILIQLNELNNKMYDGLRIIVHNSSINPEYYAGISDKGYNLANGFYSEILIKRIFSYKLGQPYNDCLKEVNSIDSFDSELYRYILNSSNYTYRQKDCLELCMGKELYKYFKITHKIDHWLNVYLTLNMKGFSNKELNNFIYYEFKEKILNNCGTNVCPFECDTIKYELTGSLTRFSLDSLITFVTNVANSNNFLLFKNLTLNDLVYFTVYFEDSAYTSISEIPKMSFLDLIANIGGNLGLFIGISFLSFAEFIELLIEIFIILKGTHHQQGEDS